MNLDPSTLTMTEIIRLQTLLSQELSRRFETSAGLAFTDIAGSTELVARLGDRKWRDLLERHNAVVRHELERYRGRGIVVRRSDDCGAWHADAEPATDSAGSPCERERRRRYWHHPGPAEPPLATGTAAATLARR